MSDFGTWPVDDPRPLDERLDEVEAPHRAARQTTDDETTAVEERRRQILADLKASNERAQQRLARKAARPAEHRG